jgi:hypothetical protein
MPAATASAIQWSDWIPGGIVLLSGKPPDTARAAEDISQSPQLLASIVPLHLTEQFEGADDPPSLEDFFEECKEVRKPRGRILIPNFVPPPLLNQSLKLLEAIERTEWSFILCVEPSQRRPVSGPRIWTNRADAVLSIRNGVLHDLRSGKSAVFQPGRSSCAEALRELLKDGPLPSRVVKRKMLDLGYSERTFWNSARQVAEHYLALSDDPSVRTYRPFITSREGEGSTLLDGAISDAF